MLAFFPNAAATRSQTCCFLAGFLARFGFERPGVHCLAALLLYPAKIEEISLWLDSDFLVEFAHRSRQQILSFRRFALRNAPGAFVFLPPKRPAWMDQQHLELARSVAIHQDSRAYLGRHVYQTFGKYNKNQHDFTCLARGLRGEFHLDFQVRRSGVSFCGWISKLALPR